jgi:hypothetical protein
MKRLWLNTLVFALCAVGSAVAQDVRYDYDPAADFTKYKTYRWVQHPDSLQLDQLTLTQLGAAFDAELSKKGLQKASGETSDLVFVYQIATQQEKSLTAFSSGWGYGPGWRYGGGGYTTTTATTETIVNGSVALDMYDAATKKMIWRGVATKTLDPGAKPDKRRKNMAKAAQKMLKNYPPPVKK